MALANTDRLKVARERLKRLKRRAHPDVGELAGARADVSFYARLAGKGGPESAGVALPPAHGASTGHRAQALGLR